MSKERPHKSTVNGMAIRLPEKVVRILQELKKEESLPSMAAALQAWLGQQVEERTETRLGSLEEKIEHLQQNENRHFLWLEALVLWNQVMFQSQLLPKRESGRPGKLPEFMVADLRRVKENLEILKLTDSWYYSSTRAHIYMSGNRKEDTTPEMHEAFVEWAKDIAATKQQQQAEQKQK